MTKKELEDAVKEGRVDVEHVLLRENATQKDIPPKEKLIELLLSQKEYICEDGEHYGEHDIDLSMCFDSSPDGVVDKTPLDLI